MTRGYTDMIEDYLTIRDLINALPSRPPDTPVKTLENEMRKTMDKVAFEIEAAIIKKEFNMIDVLRLICIKFDTVK